MLQRAEACRDWMKMADLPSRRHAKQAAGMQKDAEEVFPWLCLPGFILRVQKSYLEDVGGTVAKEDFGCCADRPMRECR